MILKYIYISLYMKKYIYELSYILKKIIFHLCLLSPYWDPYFKYLKTWLVEITFTWEVLSVDSLLLRTVRLLAVIVPGIIWILKSTNLNINLNVHVSMAYHSRFEWMQSIYISKALWLARYFVLYVLYVQYANEKCYTLGLLQETY